METIRAVYDLTLKPFKGGILAFTLFYYTIIFSIYTNPIVYTNPLLAFLVDRWWYVMIYIITPLVVAIIIMAAYYFLFFKKITLFDERYFINPVSIDNYCKLPSMVLSENFETRFSFKLKLFGDMPSKFQGNPFILVVSKPTTIKISIIPRKELKQEPVNYNQEIFYIKQCYERYSPELSFVVSIRAEGAIDATQLRIYLICEKSLNKFLDNLKIDPDLCAKYLIHTENFNLCK